MEIPDVDIDHFEDRRAGEKAPGKTVHLEMAHNLIV
jgi:hypothetical protein